MANKKDPPFFNEDNMGPFHCKLAFCQAMELFIEKLTGTCFALQVFPFEPVFSVKVKIQILEGIPVYQQHLVWNNMELKDERCLKDYNISEGCTLKLILSMRVGPLETRRVPVEDSIRETTGNMNPSRDEASENRPSNDHLTVLVYQGDQLKFLHLVDQGDGTLTPSSESLSGGSAGGSAGGSCADDEAETEASPSGQQIIENSITRNKMKLLKAKMQDMNLTKMAKRIIKAARRRSRLRPPVGQSRLPPPGNSSQSSQNELSALSTLATSGRTTPSTTNDFLKEDDTGSQSASSMKLPPKISRVKLENAKLPTNSIQTADSSLPANSDKASEKVTSASEEDAVLIPNLTNAGLYGTEEKLLLETDAFALLTELSTTEQCSGVYDIGKVNPELELSDGDDESKAVEQHRKPISKVLSTAAMGAGLLSTHELSPQKNLLLSPLRYSAQAACHSSLKPQAQPKCFEAGNFRSPASPNVLRTLEVRNIADSSFSRTTRFRSVKVESLGKRPDVISKAEVRDITDMANRASKEPVSSSAHGLGMNGSIAAVGKRVGESEFSQGPDRKKMKLVSSCDAGEASHLPPVSGSIPAKKKIKTQCFLCGKKTGLTNSFECRCGNNFCAKHRHAEAHACTYDYKSAA